MATEPGLGDGPRDRMIRSAAALISERGFAATGMRDVAEHAGAPRGSIGHHFPQGKTELTAQAIRWMGAAVGDELDNAGPDAVDVLRRFEQMWRGVLLDSEFLAGCSIAAVAQECDTIELISVAAAVFTAWREVFMQRLLAVGVPAPRAASVATVVLAALEGAVILCRAQRSLDPLRQTSDEMALVVMGAVTAVER